MIPIKPFVPGRYYVMRYTLRWRDKFTEKNLRAPDDWFLFKVHDCAPFDAMTTGLCVEYLAYSSQHLKPEEGVVRFEVSANDGHIFRRVFRKDLPLYMDGIVLPPFERELKRISS